MWERAIDKIARMSIRAGDLVAFWEEASGEPGDLIFKPRGQWHTFWNAGDTPARILEIISPAGFEDFFAELDGLGGAMQAAPEALAELCARYGLDIKPDTVPGLLERFGLVIGELTGDRS